MLKQKERVAAKSAALETKAKANGSKDRTRSGL